MTLLHATDRFVREDADKGERMQRGRAGTGIGWVMAVGALVVTAPSSATGAVTVGEAFEPALGCSDGITFIQTVSPEARYVIPSAGVITSWQTRGGAMAGRLRLKVARPAGGSSFTTVGESEVRQATVDVLNSFRARISVETGDVLGFHLIDDMTCGRGSPVHLYRFLIGDPSLGLTLPFTSGAMTQLDLAARLEPDADQDGFGDETQDGCPTNPLRQDDCSVGNDSQAPGVEITKGAPNKLGKSKVKFRFVSDDTTARFQCKLKGEGVKARLRRFSDCSSPRKYKRLDDGRFRFQVRAVDPAGNIGTPAKDRFKVVD